MFFVSWSLSFYPSTVTYAHTLHAINCGSWIIRIGMIIRVIPTLGLYLEMLKTMFVDLGWFIIILGVFVVAFGVTSTSLMYPGNYDSMTKYLLMFLRSWFAIYGEYFLEIHVEGNATTHITSPKRNTHDEYVVWVSTYLKL